MSKKANGKTNWHKYTLAQYGLTVEDYNKMLKHQKGRCAICGKTEKEHGRHLCVDHNHKTGMVRGLLCLYCNSRLMKYIRDSKLRSAGLAKYLQRALRRDKLWE